MKQVQILGHGNGVQALVLMQVHILEYLILTLNQKNLIKRVYL